MLAISYARFNANPAMFVIEDEGTMSLMVLNIESPSAIHAAWLHRFENCVPERGEYVMLCARAQKFHRAIAATPK